MDFTKIILPRPVYSEMVLYCADRLPEEAVGLLTGSAEGAVANVSSFIPLINGAYEPQARFSVDPAEWIRVWFGIGRSGKSIIGLFHSHPASPPVPSTADLTTEWRNISSHWIISFENKQTPAAEAYRFRKDGSYELVPWTIAD